MRWLGSVSYTHLFDKDGNALKETGLVIKPEGSGLYAQDNTGKIALIGVSVEEEDEDVYKRQW